MSGATATNSLRNAASRGSVDRAIAWWLVVCAAMIFLMVMIGGITLANVRRGIVQAGTIGYWVGQPHAHRGYMTTALRVLLPSLFGELNLHRIEAACIPSNMASIRVLEKCGFSREGLARRYLCINGVWQDHLLFGLLSEDFRG